MTRRSPSPAGTLFLVVVATAIVLPGVVVVAHDTLAHRLPWTQQHHSPD